MEVRSSVSCSHKEWRRIAKRERRRRLRQKAAKERDADELQLRAALEKSADYLNWCKEQEQCEKEKEELEKQEHEEREKLWLEEEVKAHKEWLIVQERKAKARQQQLIQEEQIRKEFEAKQAIIKKKEEEEKLKREEEIKRRELLQQQIDDYIDEGIKTPEILREIIDSQPGKELCPFFSKTGACRYGDTCSRNHRRVCLSKVLLIPNFYSHFSLEKNSMEYDTDIGLEFESSETRQHFREFYYDIVPELESYGRIKTLRICCNTEIHLRGNLYVEYYTEREAARALRKLKGRWYAGRQLNCEFANFKSWRSAVCGMIKCPKGRACNFLHTFQNPHTEYDIKSPPRYSKTANSESNSKRSEQRNKSTWEENVSEETNESKHWRWSESPEIETPNKRSRNNEKQRRHSNERNGHRSSRRDKEDRSSKSSRKSRKSSTERQHHHSSSIRSGRCYEKKRESEHYYKNDKRSSKRKHDNNDRSSERSEKTSRKSSKYLNEEFSKYKSRRLKECDDYNLSDIKIKTETETEAENKIDRLQSENKESNIKKQKKKHTSKWDNRNFDEKEDVSSSDSDCSSDSSELRRTIDKRDPDGWTTTDSDNEEDKCVIFNRS
ncbi:PREDICTED: U2 small nuclear ribonucleoprotein auxiliary factor 35 kDa subunit-related protein 1-like [Polistes dominula]|uniref:U2 small nuclear ribonucleoprotein auxiliary factor 35 kDa subunit-related protein 1-like n=1 Tax=Polistes dominula TaxID=743375 RepID=A0ABM1I720_POLDO|nr:PREDICTED: U2 small nuclear ribonucleoprotein auxiliary factor 35 kDa subunit-related protein 1-like [Polistes dominula]